MPQEDRTGVPPLTISPPLYILLKVRLRTILKSRRLVRKIIMNDFDEDLNELHMGRLFMMLTHQMRRNDCVNRMIEGNELTSIQKHVLKFILLEVVHRELYQKDIEEEFHIRKSTATEMLQLLEKKEFIVRKCSEKDARLKRIIPTAKAEALRPNILEHIRQSEAQLTANISDDDVLLCKKLLCQMMKNISQQKEGDKHE